MGRRRWRRTARTTVAVSTAILCSCGTIEDENHVRVQVFDDLVLDEATPGIAFEIDACSSEPYLTVGVSAAMEMPEGAIVGVTMEHGERLSTGFGEAVDGEGHVYAWMVDVSCDHAIDVTVERLDGAVEGRVVAVVSVRADAEGGRGFTDLEVIP